MSEVQERGRTTPAQVLEVLRSFQGDHAHTSAVSGRWAAAQVSDLIKLFETVNHGERALTREYGVEINKFRLAEVEAEIAKARETVSKHERERDSLKNMTRGT